MESIDTNQPNDQPPAFLRLWFLVGMSVLVVITGLCLSLKENYPFSHFPMYQKFAKDTFYVFVSDKDGKPIALQNITLHRTGRLKKQYEGNGLLAAAKAENTTKRALSADKKEPLARPVLQWLWDNTHEQGRAQLIDRVPLHLEEVWISLEDGEIVESEAEVIASFTPPVEPEEQAAP